MRIRLDVALVTGCALLVLAAVGVRGLNGLGWLVGAVLLLDAAWLAATLWRRR